MDYSALLSIIAIIISAISVLFVVLKTGIGMGLEFRESEITYEEEEYLRRS